MGWISESRRPRKDLSELFQPRLPGGGLATVWTRADLTGHGVTSNRPLRTPQDVYEVWINFFRRKQSEYSLFIIVDSSFMPEKVIAATEYDPDQARANIPIEVAELLRGKNVVQLHSHPRGYVTRAARYDPTYRLEFGETMPFTYPLLQLIPSEGDYMGANILDNLGATTYSYLIGPDGCIRYYPISQLDFYLTKQTIQDMPSARSIIKHIIKTSILESRVRTPERLSGPREVKDYLTEGGILESLRRSGLLLERLDNDDALKLFYVLEYIYATISREHTSTGEMADDMYVLYTKVESELKQVTIDILDRLHKTYNWYFGEWVFGLVRMGVWVGLEFRDDGIWFVSEGIRIGTSEEFLFRYDYIEETWGTAFLDALIAINKFEYYGDGFFLSGLGQRFFEKYHGMVDKIKSAAVEHLGLSDIKSNKWGLVTDESKWRKVVRALHNAYDVEEDNLNSLRRTYLEYLHNNRYRSLPFGHQRAAVSILINQVHQYGGMIEHFLTELPTDPYELLDDLTNLGSRVPQGTDHATLRRIYNNWRTIV